MLYNRTPTASSASSTTALLVVLATLGAALHGAEHPPGKLLFDEDFTGREAGTLKLHGDGWSMDGAVLAQSNSERMRKAEIGDKTWQDVDVRFRVRPRESGGGGMIGLTGRGGWFTAKSDAFFMKVKDNYRVRQARQSNLNRWIEMRVVFQGRTATLFADGDKIGALPGLSSSGPVGLTTNAMAGDFDDLHVVVPEKGEKGLAPPKGVKNYLPNGSFEDVEDGVPVWWAPLAPTIERYGGIEQFWQKFRPHFGADLPHGKRCLVLRSHEPFVSFINKTPNTGAAKWRGFLKLPQDKPLTISLYMKASAGKEAGMPVWVTGTFTPAVFLVGKEWERYVHHIDRVRTDRNRFQIEIRTPGTLWIDAIQIEEGDEATEFEPHPNDGRKVYENVGAVVLNEDVPEVVATRAAAAPTLDGKLDEPAWRNAGVLTGFHGGRDGDPVTAETEAKALFDDENLYLAVVCRDADIANLVAEKTERDGATFMDDSVEVFIDANRDGRTYFNFCTNFLGTQTDGIGFDYSWNGDWESAAAKGADAWTVELKFPLANFDVSPATPAVWGLNIGREHHRLKQYPRWAPTSAKSFHEPQNYGRLRWQAPGVFRKFFYSFQDVRLLAVPGKAAAAVLSGSVKNNTGAALRGRIRVKAGEDSFETAPLDLKPGKSTPFEIADLPFGPDKAVPFLLQVVDDGRTLRRSTSFLLSVLPIVDVFPDRSYYSREPEAHLVCDVNIPAAAARQTRADISLATGEKVVWKGSYPLQPGRNLLPIPVAGLEAGGHVVKAAFVHGGQDALCEKEVELRKAAPRKGETKLDRVARVMLKDGLPYIPFMNLMGGYALQGEKTFAMYRDAGFDAVMLHYVWHRKRLFTEEMAMDNLKLAEKYGLDYFIFDCAYQHANEETRDLPYLEKRIRRIAQQRPGLLGWLVIDEPWDHPEVTISAIKDVKGWDPNRVVYANHHVPQVLKRFAGLPGDAVSTDHYVSAVPSRRIENVALYTRQFEVIARELHVPTWFFISGGSQYYAPREGTPGELTAQVYGHLAAGGNGLFTFIGEFLAPATWKRLQQLHREVKFLTPMLASRGIESVPQVPDPAPEIITGTWRHRGAYYVIAASQSHQPISAKLDLGALQLGRATQAVVLFEARAARIADFAIKDRFKPYDRHVYCIVP